MAKTKDEIFNEVLELYENISIIYIYDNSSSIEREDEDIKELREEIENFKKSYYKNDNR